MIHEGWAKFYAVDPDTGCWLWTGSVHPNGYGSKGMYKAHRLFYEMENGPVPEGLCVCHKCDIPLCVNPDHLWLGTHAENMRDKAIKGRVNDQNGELNPNARLKASDIAEIRSSNRTHKALAAEFGISRPHVTRIKSGHAWSTP